MNISKNRLGVTPMSEATVQIINDTSVTMSREHLQAVVQKLCLSRERLRAERDGLQIMLDELDRKVRHGCGDANCGECDR